jgi:sugar-specific transcriptional regulator TrmB
MTKKKSNNLDEMDRLLGVFGFSVTESIIYKIVLKHPLYSASEIWSEIDTNKSKVAPYIYSTLNFLEVKGWIKKVGEKPIRYLSETKKNIRNAIDGEIAETQNLLDAQKKSYRSLLDIIEQSQKFPSRLIKPSVHSSIKNRLKKMPEGLQDWIVFTQQNNKWLIGKTEANMRITFPWEKIEFRFNSIEFDIIYNESRIFGGLILVDIINNELGDIHQTVQRVHDYNRNGFKFAYKMERKGYNESKTERHIRNVEINPGSYDEQNYRCISELSLELQGKKSEGQVITEAVSKKCRWIVTVWAENYEVLNIFEKNVSFLKDRLLK